MIFIALDEPFRQDFIWPISKRIHYCVYRVHVSVPKKENVVKGFHSCGIYPVNRSKIPSSAFAYSRSFDLATVNSFDFGQAYGCNSTCNFRIVSVRILFTLLLGEGVEVLAIADEDGTLVLEGAVQMYSWKHWFVASWWCLPLQGILSGSHKHHLEWWNL